MSGYAVVNSTSITTTNDNAYSRTATCAAGKKAISGGFVVSAAESLYVLTSGPTTVTAQYDSWTLTGERIQKNVTFYVYAICVTMT